MRTRSAQLRAVRPDAPPRRRVVERVADSALPTFRGVFRIYVFRDVRDGKEHIAMVYGDIDPRRDIPVRMHSECLTSEVFGSLRCDCKAQLDRALDHIVGAGSGVLIYLRQEGRGIGLANKIRAYKIQQEQGFDTVQANAELGFEDDLRRYDMAADMLADLGVTSVELMTNNPNKMEALRSEGIHVARRIASVSTPNALNADYLRTKRDKSGHLIDFVDAPAANDTVSDE